MFKAISYQNSQLLLLDQLALPLTENWITCTSLHHVADCIENMTVRGAPAIACSAAFAFAIDIKKSKMKYWGDYHEQFKENCIRLKETRPTAVNLFHTIQEIQLLTQSFKNEDLLSQCAEKIENWANDVFSTDLNTCKKIGLHGLKKLEPKRKIRVLTHCNTGSLATAGYGTALGIIRSLYGSQLLEHVYVDETRPWLQGARLTTYELMKEKIPHTLIAESSAAYLMNKKLVDWVIVGADRIAANGDTANKIGTYSLAVIARYHGVKFIVAAPWSSFDPCITSGHEIPIEERPGAELTSLGGKIIAPKGCTAFNPSYDVTPHHLIDWIITESGALTPPYSEKIQRHFRT